MMGQDAPADVLRAVEVLAPIVSERGTSVAVVLGSGLSSVADDARDALMLPYSELPGFPAPTVAGHPGRVAFGEMDGVQVAFLVGRGHLYEGLSAQQVAVPVRTLALAGVRTLVLTNACGGVAEHLVPGDVVAIADHIDMTGTSPLLGTNIETLGPRFPVMAGAWDAALRAAIVRSAHDDGVTIHEGVYAGLRGPAYETAAEVRALRVLGADVVGMSTVTEAVAARHAGIRLAGLSLVTNRAGTMDEGGHEAVLQAAAAGAVTLTLSLRGLLRHLAAE